MTTFIVGRFALPRIESLLSKESHLKFNIFDYVISGFMIVTVYAGFFSIFYKVGIVANVLLLIICALMLYADRKVYSAIKQVNVRREIDVYTIVLLVMALLVVFPLIKLIRSKRWKEIGVCIAIAVIMILPYLIRNFFISG